MALTGRNRVLSREFGYQKIENLKLGYHELWDGQDWVKTLMTEIEPERVCRVRFKEGSFIECSKTHTFFGHYGWIPAKEMVNMEAILTRITKFETNINYLCPKFSVLPKFEFGLLLAKIRRYEDGCFSVLETDFGARKETLDLLSKLYEFNSYTKYVYRKNQKVFEVNDDDLLKYKINGIPDEVYSSYDVMKGFLRGLFDRAYIINKTLVIEGYNTHLQGVKELLRLFSIRTRLKNGLQVYRSDRRHLRGRIGFNSFLLKRKLDKLNLSRPSFYQSLQCKKVVVSHGYYQLYHFDKEIMCAGFITNGV